MWLGEEAKEKSEEDIITSEYGHFLLSNPSMVKSYDSCHWDRKFSIPDTHVRTERTHMSHRKGHPCPIHYK